MEGNGCDHCGKENCTVCVQLIELMGQDEFNRWKLGIVYNILGQYQALSLLFKHMNTALPTTADYKRIYNIG